MFPIRKPLAKRLGVKTSELPELVTDAFHQIEAGLGDYTWAFELAKDAEMLCGFSSRESFRPYPRPNSMEEAGAHLLAEIFPKNCNDTLKVQGQKICVHPYIGPRAGAGSIQCEAPHLIPRESWLDAYGLGEGWLVLVRLI